MSDKGVKISDMPELTQLTGDETIPAVSGGNNFRFKLRNIKTLISKDDLGLDKVANLTPAEYPISDLTQAALDEKAAKVHEHAISEVTGLQTALDGKAPTQHEHGIGDVTGLQTALDSKADEVHHHGMSDVDGLVDALNGKAPSNHQHSMSAINGLTDTLNGIQDQVNQKAAGVHHHNAADVDDFDTAVVASVNLHFPGAGDVVVGTNQW